MNIDDLQFDLTSAKPNPTALQEMQNVRSKLLRQPERRGDLPKLKLFIGVVAIMVLAAFAWTYSNNSEQKFGIENWKLTATSFEARNVEPRYLKDISATEISPDKNWIAYGDRCGHLRVIDYDLENVMALPGYSSQVSSIAWSSDSQQIAAGTMDGTILLYDRRSGIQSTVLTSESPLRIQQLAFCSEDSTITAITERAFYIVDVSSGNYSAHQLFSAHGASIYPSPNGKSLFIYGYDDLVGQHNGAVKLYFLNLQQADREFKPVEVPTDEFLFTGDWAPDSQTFFMVNKSGRLLQWSNISSGDLTYTSKPTFAPLQHGQRATFSCLDNERQRMLIHHHAYMLKAGKVAGDFKLPTDLSSGAINRDGQSDEFLFAKGGLTITDSQANIVRLRVGQHCFAATKAIRVGSTSFAVLDDSGILRLVDGLTSQIVSDKSERVYSIERHPRLSNQLFVSSNRGLHVFDVLSNQRTQIGNSDGQFTSIKCHPVFDLVAAFSDESLFVADLVRDKSYFLDLPKTMHTMDWHPDRKELVLGPYGYRDDLNVPEVRRVHNGVYVWKDENPKDIRYFEPSDAELRDNVSVAFNKEGTQLVAATAHAQIALFDWENQTAIELAGRNNPAPHHTHEINRLVWNPDDPSQLISGSTDASICTWDTELQNLKNRFRFHQNAISAIAIAGHGQTACSADLSGNLFIWDVNSPGHPAKCKIPWPINDVAWDESNQHVIVCHSLGTSIVDVKKMQITHSTLFRTTSDLVVNSGLKPINSIATDRLFAERNVGLLLATPNIEMHRQ